MSYLTHLRGSEGMSQREALSGQTRNSAAGYTWDVDDWKRLDRFLVLGSLGGTYYATEAAQTGENLTIIEKCIKEDGLRVVRRIVEISDAGRAPKNEPAILALSLCFKGDEATKRAAQAALSRVCRTGTHLLHFAAYIHKQRGWGRSVRTAVNNWYASRSAADVAYQAVKYQQRDGWAQRDVLRLAHPSPQTPEHQIIFNWIIKGWPGIGEDGHPAEAAQLVWAFERAKTADKPELLRLIRLYRLPREAVPTQYQPDPDVWEALLPSMGLTALLRNLGNMSKSGLVVLGSNAALDIERRLLNDEEIRRSRVHPIQVLMAQLVYTSGAGIKGDGKWVPVKRVAEALNSAFYSAFGNVQPTGKRILLAVDESGSMSSGTIAGVPGLTPKAAAAVMTLITANVEADTAGVAFTEMGSGRPFSISKRRELSDVIREFQDVGNGTDCSEPIRWAGANGLKLDAIVEYTDSQTWQGRSHPAEAIKLYRRETGLPTRLIVVGCTATGPSIADPNDALSLDLVGFDTATPNLISDFIQGEF